MARAPPDPASQKFRTASNSPQFRLKDSTRANPAGVGSRQILQEGIQANPAGPLRGAKNKSEVVVIFQGNPWLVPVGMAYIEPRLARKLFMFSTRQFTGLSPGSLRPQFAGSTEVSFCALRAHPMAHWAIVFLKWDMRRQVALEAI